MPRSLSFQYKNSRFECELNKIDRSKIYGSVDVLTTDHEGAEADLHSLLRDGRTLVGYGGTGSGYVNAAGLWVESGERIPVDADGDPLDLIESSFKAEIKLNEIVDETTLLDHPIRLAYHLVADDPPAGLTKELKSGKIFHFDFSYRGGPTADPAFLLADTDGDIWLLIGNAAEIDFRTYKQVAICAAAATDEVEDDSEDDNFDFDML